MQISLSGIELTSVHYWVETKDGWIIDPAPRNNAYADAAEEFRGMEYIILGPWESDPNHNVISYLSPLGAELWSHKKGDELVFTINEKKFHYLLDEIEKAELKH